MAEPARIDVSGGVVAVAAQLVDIPSVSHHEAELADAVERVLSDLDHLMVIRHGNTIVARTELGRTERVIIAGHLDTVPANGNLPHSISGGKLFGLGACDMKAGVAVALGLAVDVREPNRDVTYLFYECEEVESRFNGLQHLADHDPHLLAAHLAILMEPSNAGIEAGCQGTVRVDITVPGERAHSARAWLGVNAIHGAAEILQRLADYRPRRPVVDGLEFREGLNAVGIRGGVAGNVIPDECVVTVNFRFAPDRTEVQAVDHLREVFEGFAIAVVDSAPAARPSLDVPIVAEFAGRVPMDPQPKYGWTDVARFVSLGVPALNFGPGDPSHAHTRDEFVPLDDVLACDRIMREWLQR